ncbi:peptidoglycan-binding protein, partial [Arthrobacter sp. AK01]|nr:peptidoglycan-binding protein [Arthrobacter sp. AK01]
VVVPPAEAAPQPPVNEPQPWQPGWTIHVAGAGGQDLVDACIGPVHFTPTDAYSLFITEHDYCGGWARFSGITVGQTVTLAGYGTYTVDALGQVPLGGTTDHVSAVFGGFPKAVLQTCIPGTNRMLVIALN